MSEENKTNGSRKTLDKYLKELLIILFISLGAFAISFAIKALSLLSKSEEISLDILLATIVLIISMMLIMFRKIDDIVDNMRKIGINDDMRSTRLLGLGSVWFTGAELIKELGKGDMYFASTTVPWPVEAHEYINANKLAMKKGLHVQRLYANDKYNKDLAIKQSNWGSNLEGRVYRGILPLLDYGLAISDGQPQWAVLWLYTPGKHTLLYGLLIRDHRALQSLKEDFSIKWDDSVPVENNTSF
jgi:hypothetical protein